MAYNKPLGRTPIGPRADRPLGEPSEATVATYLTGDFEYYRARQGSRTPPVPAVVVRKGSLGLTASLVREVEQVLGTLPVRVKVGADAKRHLVEIRPDATGLKLSVRDTGKASITNVALAKWLQAQGVTGVIEAHWQPQTQSIVGRYTPVTATPTTAADEEAV